MESFKVGDHVRLRDDADPRAYGRIHGGRFTDGVIDLLDGRRSTGKSIRVTGDVRDDGPRDGDWYWYAPEELELVDGEVGPMTVASHVDELEEQLRQATCRALIEAYDKLPHDADGRVLRVGDRVMLAPGVKGDCDAHYGLHAGDVFRVSDTHHTTFYPIKLTDGCINCYVRPEELVHAPADEDAPDAHDEDAPEEQPEPTADIPHGLAGLRKLSEDTRDAGGMALWYWLESGTESTWGVDKHSTESFHDTLARLVGEAEAERVAPAARVAGPIERALRDEWGKDGHGSLGTDTFRVSDLAHGLIEDGRLKSREDTGTYTADLFAGLLDELGDTCEVTTLAGKQLPEGCHWPTYADGTPVEIGDRYVSSSGDVRTVEYVAVAIGASALCAQDLDDDLYEPGECVERPAPADTWDQLREDATLPPESYCDRHDVNLDDGWEPSDAVQAMALDLIDRTERLAKGGE